MTKAYNAMYRSQSPASTRPQSTLKALQHKVVFLATLQEIVRLLEQQGDLADFLVKKVEAAQIHKNPYFAAVGGFG